MLEENCPAVRQSNHEVSTVPCSSERVDCCHMGFKDMRKRSSRSLDFGSAVPVMSKVRHPVTRRWVWKANAFWGWPAVLPPKQACGTLDEMCRLAEPIIRKMVEEALPHIKFDLWPRSVYVSPIRGHRDPLSARPHWDFYFPVEDHFKQFLAHARGIWSVEAPTQK